MYFVCTFLHDLLVHIEYPYFSSLTDSVYFLENSDLHETYRKEI